MALNEGPPAQAEPSPLLGPVGHPDGPADLVDAWTDEYRRDYYLVVRFVMRLGASYDDACDAAGEAFLESWQLMSSQPDRWQRIDNKPAWVRTVARRRYLRPPGPRRRPLTDLCAQVPEIQARGPDPAELTIQAQVVLNALRSLDEDARVAMALHLDGFPTRVIAEHLKVDEQGVYNVLKRARAQLKRSLSVAAPVGERRSPL